MTVDDRRAALGARLSELREAAGLSGRRLAELTGWQQSKVSRIQSAAQTITDDDITVWCEHCGVSADERAELLAELRAIRLDQARWRNRLRRGHQAEQRAFAEAEHSASVIRVLETALVPGLVQVPDYARAVFTTLSDLKGTPNDADAAVAQRMQRQSILYDAGKRIELLVTEAALRSPIAPADVMAAQVDRLVALVGVRTVRFGIVPLGVELPFPLMHGFTIIDGEVRAETLNTEVITTDPGDLKLYHSALDAIWSVAVEGDQARAILSALGAP